MDKVLKSVLEKQIKEDAYFITDGVSILEVTLDADYAEFTCDMWMKKYNNKLLFGKLDQVIEFIYKKAAKEGKELAKSEYEKQLKEEKENHEETPKLCQCSVQQEKESD